MQQPDSVAYRFCCFELYTHPRANADRERLRAASAAPQSREHCNNAALQSSASPQQRRAAIPRAPQQRRAASPANFEKHLLKEACGMDWIKLYVNLPDHVKITLLAQELGYKTNRPALALYVRLLCWCGRVCTDGDITGYG
ncbi:MAG: hypothetical protein LBC65_00160 [Oscillospiraceae bacterium]|jgi:hypothetical protein|nr:hypothetical protein [Oscillospiraceae bacterium]